MNEKIKSSVKFKNWFMNRAIKAQWIHKSKRSRKMFCLLYWFIMLIIVSGFACCAGLLYLDGLRFNADSDPSGWYSGLQYGWRFIVAVTLFVVLLVIAFCLGLYFPILYKQSKILYFQSEDYQQKVIEYGNADLSKYHIKNIKWLKKLGYIDKIRYQFYKNTKRHKKSIK